MNSAQEGEQALDTLLHLIRKELNGLYAEAAIEEIIQYVSTHKAAPVTGEPGRTLSPAVLISYADSVLSDSGETPLTALTAFVKEQGWAESFALLHLLPFFPWDTDRGFSVTDFYKVAEGNGSWEDIAALSTQLQLMFDFVANHASIDNPMVQAALIARHCPEGDPEYEKYQQYADFVIAYGADELPAEEVIAALTRPRAAPVLTPYYVSRTDGALRAFLGESAQVRDEGKGFVWTTFSRGVDASGQEQTRQVDLNYKNHKVFLEALRILLFYVSKHAAWIRLDAIGYLWKIPGSSSIHEEETHRLLAALNAALRYMVPSVVSVAEVNESQEQVVSYLGRAGRQEADLVYQFTHFPLAVHALQMGDASWYRAWLLSSEVTQGRQFVTVLGSHDGMGMKPLRGVLSEEEIETFAQHLVDERGGLPNYARLPGGRQIIYEVCATAWELVNGGSAAADAFSLQLARYRVVVLLGLMVRGVPAFYFQGVLASGNYFPEQGLDENRSVNRERFQLSALSQSLADPESRSSQVQGMIAELLAMRNRIPVFDHQESAMRVLLSVDPRVVAVERRQENERLLMLANVSSEDVAVALDGFPGGEYRDELSGQSYLPTEATLSFSIPAYGTLCLREV